MEDHGHLSVRQHVHTADLRVDGGEQQGLALDKPERFDSASGIGVRGVVGAKSLALGNTALMQQLGVTVEALRLRRPRMTPDLRRLLTIAAPAVLAGGVVQIISAEGTASPQWDARVTAGSCLAAPASIAPRFHHRLGSSAM